MYPGKTVSEVAGVRLSLILVTRDPTFQHPAFGFNEEKVDSDDLERVSEEIGRKRRSVAGLLERREAPHKENKISNQSCRCQQD